MPNSLGGRELCHRDAAFLEAIWAQQATFHRPRSCCEASSRGENLPFLLPTFHASACSITSWVIAVKASSKPLCHAPCLHHPLSAQMQAFCMVSVVGKSSLDSLQMIWIL